jgi:phosphate transporter
VGILTKEDFNNFPWTIIILAAGGLSLGRAVNSSGLLHTVTEAITERVQDYSLYGILVVFSSLILVIATFISHTVAALIILPLVDNVGRGLEEPHPNLLVMAGVLMCSAAMALPTSGFPNMSESYFPLSFPVLRPSLLPYSIFPFLPPLGGATKVKESLLTRL